MAAPWSRTTVVEGGRVIAVGGLAVEDLATRFGTPLWVVDRDELVGRMRAYRAAFGPDVTVTYAAKALCVTGVLALASSEGLSVDVASGGELATALRARVPGARLVFHGSNKSDEELAAGVAAGVGRFMVDSFSELERLAAIGRERGEPVAIALRVAPGVEADTHAAIATGHDDVKFGFTLSAGLAHQAAALAIAEPGLALRGVHCHIGSQIFTLGGFTAAAALLVGLLADLRDRHGVTLGELNLGGGLGIAQIAGEGEVDLAAYAEAVKGAVAAACTARDLDPPRLSVEPGRSVVGPAGLTLYRVGTLKHISGVRTYLSVDGGMSDNPRPALYGARYEFAAAGPAAPGRAGAGARLVSVAGKHCESGDVLAHDVALPADLRPGDLLAVAATGAYNHAMASNYNRVPRPAMVLVAGGEARLLVRRETLDDVLSLDVPLD